MATAIASSTAPAAMAQRGARRAGQPLVRIGTYGGSVLATCI
jgi:hypothetical protein